MRDSMASGSVPDRVRLQEIDERHFLAQQIFARRAQRCWSQEELATVSQVSPEHVARIEAGWVNPTLRTVVRLANALSCTVSSLFLSLDPPGESARPPRRSPLDVPGIDVDVTTDELVAFV